MKLVECVPNFSEGRDQTIIDAIIAAISEVEGVTLLDVDPGADTNRTVVTLIGTPECAMEGAFQGIKKASEIIDMRNHTGAHARQGATDVCPFVPVAGVSMEECVELAKQLGERVGKELEIPVYLYENAASKPEWQNLAEVRKGEYEALPDKLGKPEWKPDYGPDQYNEKIARTGGVLISAREFLIAYNVNLNSRDTKLAKEIAFTIREKGRAKRDENRKFVKDENGKNIMVPGTLKAVKAVGWYIDEYGIAQVSINMVNMNVSPPHMVFEECRRVAHELGVRVTGSELVGLLPLKALTDAGRYYLEKQGNSTGVPEKELIHIAVQSLGLDQLGPFDPMKKIIEYQFGQDPNALTAMTLKEFADEVSINSPAPGGGSVAALGGSLGASLATMVSNLTHIKKGMVDLRPEMEDVAIQGQIVKDALMKAIDDDTAAFNEIIKAIRLPKKTDEDKLARNNAIQEAYKLAANVPMQTARDCLKAMELARIVAQKGNPASVTDAGVGALFAKAGLEGAVLNVLINLTDIEDQEFCSSLSNECEALRKDSDGLAQIIKDIVAQKME